MDLSSLANLAIWAQGSASSEDLGFFAMIAKRFEAGGWGMYPITVCLIFMIAILADRLVVLFFKANINKDAFVRGLKKHIYSGDVDKAISYVAGQKQTPLTAVVKAGLMNVPKGEGEVQAAMDEAALRENPKIEKRTGYLAMIGNAAMLCGLLGTVSGLITCFEAVAHVNPADKATILSAGIPALVLFSILMGRTQHMLDDINETSVAVLNMVVSAKEKLRMPDRGPSGDED